MKTGIDNNIADNDNNSAADVRGELKDIVDSAAFLKEADTFQKDVKTKTQFRGPEISIPKFDTL